MADAGNSVRVPLPLRGRRLHCIRQNDHNGKLHIGSIEFDDCRYWKCLFQVFYPVRENR
jgi:hypothetical protein